MLRAAVHRAAAAVADATAPPAPPAAATPRNAAAALGASPSPSACASPSAPASSLLRPAPRSGPALSADADGHAPGDPDAEDAISLVSRSTGRRRRRHRRARARVRTRARARLCWPLPHSRVRLPDSGDESEFTSQSELESELEPESSAQADTGASWASYLTCGLVQSGRARRRGVYLSESDAEEERTDSHQHPHPYPRSHTDPHPYPHPLPLPLPHSHPHAPSHEGDAQLFDDATIARLHWTLTDQDANSNAASSSASASAPSAHSSRANPTPSVSKPLLASPNLSPDPSRPISPQPALAPSPVLDPTQPNPPLVTPQPSRPGDVLAEEMTVPPDRHAPPSSSSSAYVGVDVDELSEQGHAYAPEMHLDAHSITFDARSACTASPLPKTRALFSAPDLPRAPPHLFPSPRMPHPSAPSHDARIASPSDQATGSEPDTHQPQQQQEAHAPTAPVVQDGGPDLTSPTTSSRSRLSSQRDNRPGRRKTRSKTSTSDTASTSKSRRKKKDKSSRAALSPQTAPRRFLTEAEAEAAAGGFGLTSAPHAASLEAEAQAQAEAEAQAQAQAQVQAQAQAHGQRDEFGFTSADLDRAQADYEAQADLREMQLAQREQAWLRGEPPALSPAYAQTNAQAPSYEYAHEHQHPHQHQHQPVVHHHYYVDSSIHPVVHPESKLDDHPRFAVDQYAPPYAEFATDEQFEYGSGHDEEQDDTLAHFPDAGIDYEHIGVLPVAPNFDPEYSFKPVSAATSATQHARHDDDHDQGHDDEGDLAGLGFTSGPKQRYRAVPGGNASSSTATSSHSMGGASASYLAPSSRGSTSALKSARDHDYSRDPDTDHELGTAVSPAPSAPSASKRSGGSGGSGSVSGSQPRSGSAGTSATSHRYPRLAAAQSRRTLKAARAAPNTEA